jgi:hypothetical protein
MTDIWIGYRNTLSAITPKLNVSAYVYIDTSSFGYVDLVPTVRRICITLHVSSTQYMQHEVP